MKALLLLVDVVAIVFVGGRQQGAVRPPVSQEEEGRMKASVSFKSPSSTCILMPKHLDQCFSQNNLTISPMYFRDGRAPHVRVTKVFSQADKKKRNQVKAKTILCFPEVKESDIFIYLTNTFAHFTFLGVFKVAHFRVRLNDVILPSLRCEKGEEDCDLGPTEHYFRLV